MMFQTVEVQLNLHMKKSPLLFQQLMASEITKYENIDAVILGCFGDPGLDVFREMFDFPIIGPAQTSIFILSIRT